MSERLRLPVEALLWQPTARTHAATLITKLTLSLGPGKLEIAPEQEPLTREDGFLDDDPRRSLLYASDLVPAKKNCDVMVVGHAFSPGAPCSTLVARLRIGSIDKSLDVVADRARGTDGTLYQGGPFVRMPLLYERTAGGPTTLNPVGVRAESRDPFGRTPLPNILPHPSSPEGPFAAAGFGPIAPSWRLRADRLGPAVDASRVLAGPFPDTFDFAFFNAAPPDQQLSDLPADASFELAGLHPKIAELRAELPGHTVEFVLHRGGSAERPQARLDTLVIDTDRATVTLTYRAVVAKSHPADTFRVEAFAGPKNESWRTAAQEIVAEATHAGDEAPLVRSPQRTMDPRLSNVPFLPFRQDTGSALPFSKVAQASHDSALPFAKSGEVPSIRMTQTPRPSLPTSPLFPEGLLSPDQVVPEPMPSAAPLVSQPAPVASVSAAPLPVMGVPFAAPQFGAPPALAHASGAALSGLVAASNAAADPSPRAHVASAARFSGDGVILLWSSDQAAPALRRRADWKRVLDELEADKFDPEVDDAALADDPLSVEDRREVFAILGLAKADGPEAVDRALAGALAKGGRFSPELVVGRGALTMQFDEKDLLKATVTSVRPFVREESVELQRAIDSASKLVESDALISSPEILESSRVRVQKAFEQADRPVDATYPERQARRVLLERRSYQRREVFGAPHLRTLFQFEAGGAAAPAYLPEALVKLLPLFESFGVRMIFEVHYQADQFESHPAALRVLALARVVTV